LDYFAIVKQLLSILTPAGTLVLAFLGLSSWRKKLWGENRFSLATTLVRELYILKEEINNYRSPIYLAGEIYHAIDEYKKSNPDATIDDSNSSDYAEMYRWTKVLEQYYKFNDNLVKFKVLIDNFEIDKVNSVRMEEIVKEMNEKRMQVQFRKGIMRNLQNLDDLNRSKFLDEQEEIYNVLSHHSGADDFERKIEEYFNGFKKRIRKFIR